MVTKYQMISCLAEDTAKEIAKNGQEWTRYLTTAARLYKYPFNEQILIFAQRPDATACASIEIWNEKMNCWVNRGAKGIALLDTENSYTRLKYVFDVSDVHKARRIGRDPNLWELREEHKETVLAQLEKTYGETDKNSSFEQRIMEISNRIAFDYYEELLSEIEYVKEGSFLEELDELNVGVRIRDTLSSSIAYTILSRCGADMELWKDELGFEYISDFNTMKTLSVVGTATTDMCKPLLMEIGRTVGAYDRQIARKKAQEKANAGRTQTSLEYTEKVLANESDADYNALKRKSEKKLQNNQEIEIQSKRRMRHMKLTYEKNGDYLIPNLTANEEPEGTLTKYGLMRKNFLQEHRKGIYQGMILTGELKAHCLEIQEQAEQRMEALSEQMAKAEGVNEELKAADQMKWAAKMNNIRHSAEEIVLTELICS